MDIPLYIDSIDHHNLHTDVTYELWKYGTTTERGIAAMRKIKETAGPPRLSFSGIINICLLLSTKYTECLLAAVKKKYVLRIHMLVA